jgi:hypothetical protein
MNGTDVTLLALHGLRLTGLAEAGAVAELTGSDPGVIEVELKALEDVDLILRRDGAYRSGWLLTADGTARAAEMVAHELEQVGARPALEALYQRFGLLNPTLLDLCCRWQLRDLSGQILNDHTDIAYDRTITAALAAHHKRSEPLLAELAGVLTRLDRYGPRLAHALDRVLQGDTDFFTKPITASYHTVWFELHEDLLTTLALDRAAETARLARHPVPGSR